MKLVIEMEDYIYQDILMGNIVLNRAIIQNIFENAKPITELDDEKKAEYKRGYEHGRMSALSIKEFEEIRRLQRQRRESRTEQADRAYQYGMERAWEAARKIYDIQNAEMVKELFGADANYIIHNFTAPQVLKKIETLGRIIKNRSEEE